MSEVQLVDYPNVTLVTKSCTCSHSELGPTIGQLYKEIGEANPEMAMVGAPRIYYTVWAPESCTIQAAIPVPEDAVAGSGTVKVAYPAGTAYMSTHIGPYEGLVDAWSSLMSELSDKGLYATGLCWDDYQTDPGVEPDSSKWRTDIYIAVDIPKI